MKFTGKQKTASLLLSLASFSVPAATIIDNYIGANTHDLGDVIGSERDFQINHLIADITGTILTVSIDTTFAGKGDNGLFSDFTTDGNGIGYGDLFLSSTWNPFGSAPYENDHAGNGTTWSHGFSLDNRYMNENDAGTGILYNLTSQNNHRDINMSGYFLDSGLYRNNQEVAVDRDSLGVIALGNAGMWSITDDTVEFEIDLFGTGLLDGPELAMRWGFTCANDVIEGTIGVPPVPVPAAIWLFGTGLLGLVAIARRR